jgi:hypothetical protein
VRNSPKLPTCQAEKLAMQFDLPEDKINISGNGGGTCE